MSFALDPEWMRFILEKGYIAVDGCSLTVVSTTEQSFEIWLIPETLDRTGLGDKVAGDLVNIEIDAKTQAVVETVERIMGART